MSQAASSTHLVTAEELLELPDLGRCELIDGRIVPMSPSGWEHGVVVSNITLLLGGFVKSRGLGVTTGAETGFVLKRNPDRVRAPDFAFVHKDRAPSDRSSRFFEGAPDLAVEVKSPSDRSSEVLEKVDEWLSAGAQSCWVVDPKIRSVVIHRTGGEVVHCRAGDEIRDEPVLPGLVLKVDAIFE